MIKSIVTGVLIALNVVCGVGQVVDIDQLVTIPVVVHVVYANTTQNISDSQIYSQIDVLNEDYRRQNADSINTPLVFHSVAADTRIEFVLANFDPLGNPTSGITRTSTSKAQFFNDQITSNATDGQNSWGTDYLNIWVGNLPDGISGWANDSGADTSIQGVIIDFEFFGREGTAKAPYHLGRTTTHEVGHWLNLQHLEGIQGGCFSDDNVVDTPLQEMSLSGAISTNTSCGSTDMVTNYMQLVDDAIMNLFTLGQKERMRKLLFDARQSLLLNINKTVGLSERQQIGLIDIFPNPISGNGFSLNTTLPDGAVLELFDIQGKNISSGLHKISDTQFELSAELNSGMYLVSYQWKNHYYRTKINLRF